MKYCCVCKKVNLDDTLFSLIVDDEEVVCHGGCMDKIQGNIQHITIVKFKPKPGDLLKELYYEVPRDIFGGNLIKLTIPYNKDNEPPNWSVYGKVQLTTEALNSKNILEVTECLINGDKEALSIYEQIHEITKEKYESIISRK